MKSATEAYHERVVVIFDFDLTLAPGCLDALLERCGQDPQEWRSVNVDPLQDDGWEEILASIHALVGLSHSENAPRITQSLLRDVGRNLRPFDGVPAMFKTLRSVAADVLPSLDVDFFLISSGYSDIMRNTCIAHEFKNIWGTELHFDEEGNLAFPKLIVTHPEKVRYILALSKGLDPTGANAPAHIYQDVEGSDLYVPLDQIIYVGDGRSDMSAFRLMEQNGGLAIGLTKRGAADWNGHDRMDPERRVQNIAEADYTEGSELMHSLQLAVGSIAQKIALRRLGCGE